MSDSYSSELRYSITSRISHLVRTLPIGGMADGPFVRRAMSVFTIRLGAVRAPTRSVRLGNRTVSSRWRNISVEGEDENVYLM